MKVRESQAMQEFKSRLTGEIATLKEKIDSLKKEMSRKEKELHQKEMYLQNLIRIEDECDPVGEIKVSSEEKYKDAEESQDLLPQVKREPSYDISKRRKKVEEIISSHGGKDVHLTTIAEEIGMGKESLAPWMLRLSEDPNSGIIKEPYRRSFTLMKPHSQPRTRL